MIISRSKIATGFFAMCAMLAVAPVCAQQEEKDAFVCMEESQETCDYKNKNMELFIKGRDAFDRARESGDLSEARSIARELIGRGDTKHGNDLMKYVYVQVSLGVHKNLVEAYRWVVADLANGATYRRLSLERVLEQLAAKMTPEQLAEAEK